MSGTREGAIKSVAVIKERYGQDYFKKIAAKGGSAKVPKGFAIDNRTWLERLLKRPTRAVLAGRKSKRT